MNLDEILSPISTQEFLEKYWGRVPLYVPGEEDKFRNLFSLDRFLHLLKYAPIGLPPMDVKVGMPVLRKGIQTFIQIDPSQAESAYKGGGTVCLTRLDNYVPELRSICRSLQNSLGFQGIIGMNAYWSPEGQGFDPHFDGRIASTLQLDGHKTWRYSMRPALAWPRRNGIYEDGRISYPPSEETEPWENEPDPESLEGWVESTLKPGDFLSLPAGVWHSASARGSSFAINLFFNGQPVGEWIGTILQSKLGSHGDWRHVPPLLGHEGIRGGKRSESEQFVISRLDEAIAYLKELREDPARLMTTALSPGLSHQPAPPARGPWLRISPDTAVLSHSGDEICRVVLGDAQIVAKGKLGRVLQTLLRLSRFHRDELRVEEVTSEEVTRAMNKLIDLGVVVDAPPA